VIKKRVRVRDNPIVEVAKSYEGYTARGNNNTFAIDAGIQGGFQWDGAFIDRVLAQAGVMSTPKHTNTTTALSFYLANGLVYRTPHIGDIVFYSFPTASNTASFDPSHVGIVTDVTRWKKETSFRAIEAQVSSGQPKAPTEENGVYERTRYATDVLAFARVPKKKLEQRTSPVPSEKELVTVKPAYITRCTSVQQAASARPELRRAVEAVQIALAAHPAVRLRDANRGVFDLKTRRAYAAFERFTGIRAQDCNGTPTVETLELLSEKSTFFRAEI
jgi:hypothetical protein